MVLDTVVIGAGAMGSSTAYWLSKYQQVALIDQYELLHTRGSSHGESRVIRKTYQQEHFAEMMPKAYSLWNKIQNETNTHVFDEVGGLDVGKEGNEDLKKTLEICQSRDIDHEILDHKELKDRFPAYQDVDNDYYAIYQPETGILHASKAVSMFQKHATFQGAQIMQNTPVTSIKSLDDSVLVDTVKGSFQAKHVVISAGSWINLLLKDLGYDLATEVWKLTFAYYKVTKPEFFSPEKFPVFIHWAEKANYGFPIHEKSNYVKIAPHVNELIEKVPVNDGINEVNSELLDSVSEFIDNTFVGIDTSSTLAETCLYTMTPDENFIIDHLPETENITIVGGFSGHGFKFTPLIGRIVQKMVMGEEQEVDLSHFKINKFLR